MAANLMALFFGGGATSGEVLAAGTFTDQDSFVKECMKKMRQLPSILDGRIVITDKINDAPESSSGARLIKRSESLYDVLYEESERFFDVPR